MINDLLSDFVNSTYLAHMKRFYLLSFICVGMVLLSLYLTNEVRYSGDTKTIARYNSGWKFLPWSVIPAVLIVLITVLIRVKQNLVTAVIGLIFSFINLIFVAWLLAAIMTFTINFFGSYETSKLSYGYFITLLSVIFHFVLMLVLVIRQQKKTNKHASVYNVDLIDTEV